MTEDSINTKRKQTVSEDHMWLSMVEHQNLGDEEELLKFLYQGLIFPKQDSLMLRVRMTGAELSSSQLMGLASIAESYGGGYADVTTRANFQIREISPSSGIRVLRELLKLDILPAQKALNNLRNITVTPTSGFDVNEVTEVIPLAKNLTELILYQPDLQGLPGKFNIAIDSGGSMSVSSESNDIGLKAIEIEGRPMFRVSFATLKGEETVAEDAGWLINPDKVPELVFAAIIVFLEFGDFSKRLKSRLKFYISSVGIENFKTKVMDRLLFKPVVSSLTGKSNRIENSHIGIWPQKQKGYSYVGTNGASGRYTAFQLKGLAELCLTKGSDRVRLTMQKNCIIPGVKNEKVKELAEELRLLDLSVDTKFNGEIIACTGSNGCSYSATDTKLHARRLESFLVENITLNQPVNIHFTGCPFSCAQAYIGDIGLLGATLKGVEVYHLYLGGGADRNITGRKVKSGIGLENLNQEILNVLTGFTKNGGIGESFVDYVERKGSAYFSLEGGMV